MASEQRCGDYNPLLSAYLDGEVTAAERSELLQHMATCASCRTTMDEYRFIGTQLRGLPPLLTPDDLTDAIYAQTVDAPPRRLSLLTSRVRYPIAAVAAVLLVFVVAAFLLLDGYERSIDPNVVGSQPLNGAEWSVNSPIKITFNKEMDRESVVNALKIQPTSERERLDIRWEGNTLVIGGNTALKPSSTYAISFTNQARDKWGNPLSEKFSLTFGTNTTLGLEPPATTTPTPPATAQAEAEVPAVPTRSATATKTPPPATATPESTSAPAIPPASTNTPVPPSQSGPDNGGAADPDEEEPVGVPSTSTPVPEPTQTAQPTATPAPVETEEPTPVPATPTVTPTPEPSPTPGPTETEEPTTEPEPSPTQGDTTHKVEGSFGNVYWRNETVRAGLGDPVEAAVDGISALELDFQEGKMFQAGTDGQIYVMYTTGAWGLFSPVSGEPSEFTPGSEEGLWIPGGVFGLLWNANPELQKNLGEALERQNREFPTSSQQFESGIMLANPDGFIYVIYAGNTWELYPDAGPLSDGEPTPVQ